MGTKMMLSRFFNLKQILFVLGSIILYFCFIHHHVTSSLINFVKITPDNNKYNIQNLNNNGFGNLDLLKKTPTDGGNSNTPEVDLNDPTQTTDIKVQLIKNNKNTNDNSKSNSNSNTKTASETNSNSDTNSQPIPNLDYSKAFNNAANSNSNSGNSNPSNEKLLLSLKSSIESQEKEIRTMKR